MDPLGILGNIVATILVFLAGVSWRSVIAPHVHNATYRGTRVDGVWTGEQDLPHATYRFHIRLIQFGSKLSGVFTSNDTYKPSNGVPQKMGAQEYKVSGLIQDGYLFLQYEIVDRGNQGMGGFLFSIESQGRELEGHMLFLRSARGNSRIGTTSTEVRLYKQ